MWLQGPGRSVSQEEKVAGTTWKELRLTAHPILCSPYSGAKCWGEVVKPGTKEKRCGGRCTSDHVVLFSVLF